MAKTVTFDTLELEGANIWVDLATGDIRLEMGYRVSSSTQGVSISKVQECQDLLTPEERTTILNLTSRLKSALEAQELT